ncbi:hypothetical protein SAMN05192545_1615 [Maribacter dokdonensis]|uniref:Uncharacterized protein n=1 Tax=Maribacter dokdonensis TaxID=320912 RepID=A0A1H4RK94_9FLAO|nr:hypothetical protein I600_98 [Maribacter dokdonensis DSW-8]SDS55919.1 hypothetical protein SAMN05192545_1615 [Maribacter dokdonensis]SEC32310.1 hypothetical protein SAMN05192540_2891 [Maribacter dokdonensis]
MSKDRNENTTWKKEYTIVLVLNLIYVLVFYYVMTSFN